VLAALRLPEEERELAVPAAVEALLQKSADRAEAARMLGRALEAARPRLLEEGPEARRLLARLGERLREEEERASERPRAEEEVGPSASSRASGGGETSEGSGGEALEEEAEAGGGPSEERGRRRRQEGRPFCLGPVRLPLAPLLKIANGLEVEDLCPAAQSCKSLCIAININLQYVLFLVRLLRLIALGPEAARALREQEESSEASSEDS